jgi:hypothetical protein
MEDNEPFFIIGGQVAILKAVVVLYYFFVENGSLLFLAEKIAIKGFFDNKSY